MPNQSDHSDALILDKIKNNHLAGWEELYDAYSATMLTMICKLCTGKNKGEELLIKLFTGYEFKKFIATVHSKLPFHLSRFAFCFAAKELHRSGLEPNDETLARLPQLLKLLYKTCLDEEVGKGINTARPLYRPVFAYSLVPVLEAGVSA